MANKALKILGGVAVCAYILMGIVAIGIHQTQANVTRNDPAAVNNFQEYTFFATSTNQSGFATTTSATSTNITPWFDTNGRKDNGYFVVAGAKAVSVFFSRDAGTGSNNGSTAFNVQVSYDGSNWVDYNKLVSNVTNSNSQTLTRVANVTITAATTTTMVGVDVQNDAIYAIRCIVVETTDGSHSCKATARY